MARWTHACWITGLLAAAANSPGAPAGPPPFARWGAECRDPETVARTVWCRSRPPVREERRRIADAIRRMRARGATCDTLASRLEILLRGGRLRLFDDTDYAAGAAASLGDVAPFVIVARAFVNRFYDAAHRSANAAANGASRPETLQQVLAHEADHLAGLVHLDHDGYFTPHTRMCSDLHYRRNAAMRRSSGSTAPTSTGAELRWPRAK